MRKELARLFAPEPQPEPPSPAIPLGRSSLCIECSHIVLAAPSCSRCGSRSLYPVEARMNPDRALAHRLAFRPRAVGEVTP